MIALFDHYSDMGNIGGDSTDVYIDTIKANTVLRNGDKFIAKYWIKSAIDSFTVNLVLPEINISISGVSEGDNVVELFLMRSGNANMRYQVSLSTNSSSQIVASGTGNGESPNFPFDFTIRLSLQDTSESPADNTVVAKMGTVLFIPAS